MTRVMRLLCGSLLTVAPVVAQRAAVRTAAPIDVYEASAADLQAAMTAGRRGMVPLSHTQDIGGPLARTMMDLAIALDVTVGHDAEDAVTRSMTCSTGHPARACGRSAIARSSSSARSTSTPVPWTTCWTRLA